MKLLETITDTRLYVADLSGKQLSVGFVPTMGALHAGHLSLVRRAARENDRVAVSIFVNPIQFNNPSDLEKYPRDLAADLEQLGSILGEDDFVFAPTVPEMYPEPDTRVYDFGPLATVMEGRFRPGHFNGVGVVVNKLLRIVEPQKAYFGEKDFQQLAIIRELVRIEQLPVQIVPCAIVREPDGLAMSSRNVRLTPEHRSAAPVIYQTLRQAAGLTGESSPAELRKLMTCTLEQSGLFRVEYIEFADETTLVPVDAWEQSARIRCFLAIQAGEVRLIDNHPLYPAG